MAQPRFLFVAGTTSAGWTWPPWLGDPDGGQDDPTGSWVAWRLTGSNNRELGRSARTFADLAACRADAERLVDVCADAVAVPTVSEPTSLWGWRLELAGRPIAVSGRLYSRQRECHYNLAQFRAAVPTAVLSEQITVLTRPPGRREPGPGRRSGPPAQTRRAGPVGRQFGSATAFR